MSCMGVWGWLTRFCISFAHERLVVFHCACGTIQTRDIACIGNFLPLIDLNLSLLTIKNNLKRTFWKHFEESFKSSDHCSFHLLCPDAEEHLPILLSRVCLARLAACMIATCTHTYICNSSM